MNPAVPSKETTSWMVCLKVTPILIPSCLSHQQVFWAPVLEQPQGIVFFGGAIPFLMFCPSRRPFFVGRRASPSQPPPTMNSSRSKSHKEAFANWKTSEARLEGEAMSTLQVPPGKPREAKGYGPCSSNIPYGSKENQETVFSTRFQRP